MKINGNGVVAIQGYGNTVVSGSNNFVRSGLDDEDNTVVVGDSVKSDKKKESQKGREAKDQDQRMASAAGRGIKAAEDGRSANSDRGGRLPERSREKAGVTKGNSFEAGDLSGLDARTDKKALFSKMPGYGDMVNVDPISGMTNGEVIFGAEALDSFVSKVRISMDAAKLSILQPHGSQAQINPFSAASAASNTFFPDETGFGDAIQATEAARHLATLITRKGLRDAVQSLAHPIPGEQRRPLGALIEASNRVHPSRSEQESIGSKVGQIFRELGKQIQRSNEERARWFDGLDPEVRMMILQAAFLE